MEDHIKDLICEIDELENCEEDDFGAKSRLKMLYGMINNKGYYWDTNNKIWAFKPKGEENG